MRKSNVLAAGVGFSLFGVGALAAALCPIGGLAAGAYFAGSAAATAGMSTGAVVALGGAGALGGYVLGHVARKATLCATIVIAPLMAIVTSFVGSTISDTFGFLKRDQKYHGYAGQDARYPGSSNIIINLPPAFDDASLQKAFEEAQHQKPKNDNAPKPAPTRRWTFKI